MRRLFKPILYLVVIVLFVVSYFTGKTEYPRPTESYYVNDFADVLMMSTESTITREGERLFDWTLDEVDGGSQVVFATFEVENEDEVEEYDKTDIYREWKIGKDDMGVLVLMFFMDDETDDTDELVLIETQIEVGYRMEQYLTPGELGRMLDSSIYSEDYDWLLDMGVANLLYQILEELYVNVYGYEYFSYDMDEYYEYMMDYEPDGDYSNSSMGLFLYVLSPYSTWSEKIFVLLPYVFVALFGGGYVINKGAGGSSGGMGVFRRRR